ncbi:thiamine monophosphate kinase [Ventosimonas gracilis]|uniref:Thiamine-monophosphate kinase n=1 Tax=Ventosimonas gracilis TaxID=1680762 RepID=A0A139SXK0_9GAMM|nr:thiamine-phosphate kinase [Ventosimonas gracilis]KXU39132.1 thiamine monophosphate kinase [Ventosimonas gracilis]
MTEFELIKRYFDFAAPHQEEIALGLGDDCALLQLAADEQLAVSTDSLVCGVHFPENAPPFLLGQRSLAVAASDLAAVGASPLAFTLALTLPEACEDWLREFSRGLKQMAGYCGLALIGGDTCRGPLHLCLTVFGSVPQGQALKRSGARAGDLLCVGGHLGDTGGGLALLQKAPAPTNSAADYLLSRYWTPMPQLALGQWLRGKASAAMDISDGLLADCAHLAEASGVCALINEPLLPLSEALLEHFGDKAAMDYALCAGDDYVLLFSLPPEQLSRLQQAFSHVCVIGHIQEGSGVVLLDSNGQPRQAPQSGWQHFR